MNILEFRLENPHQVGFTATLALSAYESIHSKSFSTGKFWLENSPFLARERLIKYRLMTHPGFID